MVGKYEFLFANYTDTSVDVVVTDSSGDIGIAQNMNIAASLQAAKIHSNNLGLAIKKGGAVPQDLSEIISKIGEVIYQDLGLTLCAAAALEASEVVVAVLIYNAGQPGGMLSTPLNQFIPQLANLGKECQDAFQDAWPEIEKLISQIGTSNPPPKPKSPPAIPNGTWNLANLLDQQIQNQPAFTSMAWSATSPGASTSGAAQGSGGTSDGISTFSGYVSDPEHINFLGVEISNQSLIGSGNSVINTPGGPGQASGTNFSIRNIPCTLRMISTTSVIYGAFTASGNFSINGGIPGTISGSFKIIK